MNPYPKDKDMNPYPEGPVTHNFLQHALNKTAHKQSTQNLLTSRFTEELLNLAKKALSAVLVGEWAAMSASNLRVDDMEALGQKGLRSSHACDGQYETSFSNGSSWSN